jgi:hypothetical protein
MSIFSRKASGSKHHNPADGREYDDVHLPNSCYGQRYSVFWTGKTLDYDATNAGHRDDQPGPVVFTDGSWANSCTGECFNAGPGELSVSRTAPGGEPW